MTTFLWKTVFWCSIEWTIRYSSIISTEKKIGSKSIVVSRCSLKEVHLKILQVLQENTCNGVSFSIKRVSKTKCFLVNIWKFLNTTFFTRAVAASHIPAKKNVMKVSMQLIYLFYSCDLIGFNPSHPVHFR